MSKTVIIDIDNCIVDINNELKRLGYRTDIYPSPIPYDIFSNGKIFSDALPMVNIIRKIEEEIMDSEATFLTAHQDGRVIQKITKEWINLHTDFNLPILYSKGIPKGHVIEREILGIKDKLGEFIIFEDSPNEILSYLSLKEKYGLSMIIYVPEWTYNHHIEGEGIIKLKGDIFHD